MHALDRIDARHFRALRVGLGLVGGVAAGLLIGSEQYVPGAAIAGVALLVTYVLPRLYRGPVTDERIDARERWASAVTIKVVCTAFTASLLAGSVALGLGYAERSPLAIGAFFGAGSVVVTYLLVLGYARLRHRP